MWHPLLPAPLGSVEALKWSERYLVLARRLHCQSCWVLQPAEPRGFVREASPWVYRCRLCCLPPVPPGEKNGWGRKDSHLKRFFWAHWNILFICFIKNNQLFSSFFSQSQHSEKTVVTESQLAFIVFKVLERKKLCGWVVMTFLFTICTDFCERDRLLPKPVNKPLVWLCVYSQHGSCDQSHLDEALLTCLE